MECRLVIGLGICSLGLCTGLRGEANYAARVAAYTLGSPNAALSTNREPALGAPSQVTVDPWGAWPVDPFGPAYLASQVITLSAGDSITLEFAEPVDNHPDHPYGVDFLAFGNTFLASTWPEVTAQGSLGGTNTGVTEVWVSADGTEFFRLDPARAPALDGLFPTDGAGDFTRPVNPRLRPEDFAGCDLTGVRKLYEGSGGGTGYDISWAQNAAGASVLLETIRFVRLHQLSGEAQLDAVSAVQPQPTEIQEDFASDPAARGWQTYGAGALFAWDPTARNLAVTWDSSRPNSYFARSLGMTLTRADDFAVAFDLRLEDAQGGANPDKPGIFQLALGLVELASATRPNLHRGIGQDAEFGARNALEFDYFPAAGGIDATISPALICSNSQFASSFVHPLELAVGDDYHVNLRYAAASEVLTTEITRNGRWLTPPIETPLPPNFTDFRLDSLAVCSYSDEGQFPGWEGSILAHGRIDNVHVDLPPGPADVLRIVRAQGRCDMRFYPRPGWRYRLLRTPDFAVWEPVAEVTATSAAGVTLSDTNAVAAQAFYRVEAERPQAR